MEDRLQGPSVEPARPPPPRPAAPTTCTVQVELELPAIHGYGRSPYSPVYFK